MKTLTERIVQRWQQAQSDEITHLGELPVGSTGQKQFGDFTLSWTVYIDHIAWQLTDGTAHPNAFQGMLSGVFKYVGWNEWNLLRGPNEDKEHINFEIPPSMTIYVHDWPHIKDALDYLYYDLGYKIAKDLGPEGRKDFIRPEKR